MRNRNKISIILGGVISVIVLFSIFNSSPEREDSETIETLDADIYMSIKSSRPGCDVTDSCYVPSTITIREGESVTWLNNDVAFHSVTSGYYDDATGLFDSGHIDPGKTYTRTFIESGEYPFFCTLHPWMYGKVIVE